MKKSKFIVRVLFSFLLMACGVIVAIAIDAETGIVGAVGRSFGISLIVAGMVSLFQELVLSHFSHSEAMELSENIQGALHRTTVESADRLQMLLQRAEQGIHIIKKERGGFSGYHKWVLESEPREMFFAGRSVLHRMRSDFKNLSLAPVEDAIVEKMKGGFRIRILFMDPRWEMVERIATMEGRASPTQLYADLEESLDVAKKIWEKLQTIGVPLSGSLEIRLCSNISQFAYHCVKSITNPDTDTEMLVGFYFAIHLGWKTPLFEVRDKEIRPYFETHFSNLFEHSHTFLNYPVGRIGLEEFDEEGFTQCQEVFEARIGPRPSRVNSIYPASKGNATTRAS